jgi:hypothetical protein
MMRINKIKRRYAKMMNYLPDNDLIACIYMLCSELIRRSGDSITLDDVLTAVWNISKLVDHNRSESEDK